MIDHDAVLAWGRPRLRSLPWRATRDPWAVLVSETMLQQTQVARVVPAFETFMARFPTVSACAAADQAEVVRLWDGLGYNRRAVYLHRAARRVADEHAGRIPADLPELLALPGVGPYTARAVLAFAHERDVGVVDTNTARLHARWKGRPLTPREVQLAADEAVPPGGGWVWNQVLFDLAAAVCHRRRPDCAVCPARSACAWRGDGADPADGSAGVAGGQSRFAGSDREGRGRLVSAMRRGPVAAADLASVAGWPHDRQRVVRVAATLVDDGLARYAPDGALELA